MRFTSLCYLSFSCRYADHRVKHVNGLKNPVVKCANLAPNDPRKCVKSTGGRGGLRRKNYEKLP
jgi:hypothetical protein